MTVKKILFLNCLYLLPLLLSGQKKSQTSGITIEVIGSALFDSERWFNHNEEEGYLYGEGRIGYRFNKYLEANAFVGYVRRYYGYFAEQNFNLFLLNMERHYVPVGLNFRVYLSEFFHEKLKLWKKKNRWDIYNQIGLAVLKGKDIRDGQEEFYKNQGANVPYYLYPYVREFGKKYLVYVAGVRYNSSKNFGIFLEGGEGARSTLQIGLSAKF